MSSLDHDRLLGEAAAAPVATPARGARPASAEGTAGAPVPPQRQGEAQPAGGRPSAASTARTVVGSGGRHRAGTPAADAREARRPTPYKRQAVDLDAREPAAVAARPTPAGTVAVRPSADADRVVAAMAEGRARRRLRVRRGPAVHLAAALIGALGITGASAAPAEVHTQSVSHSVSVAEQLGIGTTSPAVVDEDATSLLRELVTSRNVRDAERTAAADAQAEADRLTAEEAARVAAEAARPKAVHPVEGARLTSGFGARWGTLHAGIDLAAPMRTPERAAMDGIVLEAGAASGYGLVVYIQHENGDVTVYGHMDEILVEPGQVVRAGDTIALLGNRGQSTGPHLHFEVHVGGLDGPKVDPLPWLRERGVRI